MAPKRRSLRERDERAIAGPIEVLPGQTAIDLPEQPASQTPQALLGASAAAVDPAALTGAPALQQVPRGRSEGARRLGIYFHPGDFTNAKAAYLADWQNGGAADTFAAWIAAVLVDHAQLDPAQRAGAALPPRGGGGSTRSFALPQSVRDAVRAAVVADQGAERWVSASAWAGTAVHAAAQVARRRAGGPLPPPPERLPNRLAR